MSCILFCWPQRCPLTTRGVLSMDFFCACRRLRAAGKRLAVAWLLASACWAGHLVHLWPHAPAWLHVLGSVPVHAAMSALALLGTAPFSSHFTPRTLPISGRVPVLANYQWTQRSGNVGCVKMQVRLCLLECFNVCKQSPLFASSTCLWRCCHMPILMQGWSCMVAAPNDLP